ncbi:OmpA family protein [Rhizobium herbae]
MGSYSSKISKTTHLFRISKDSGIRMLYKYLRCVVLAFALLPIAANAQDVLATATPDELVRSLNPATAQREKIRGLKIVATNGPEKVNSYGDKLTATVNLAVTFEFASAVLTPEAQELLDSVGEALKSRDLATYRFLIGGHTDATGSNDANLQLSRARAASTTRYLVERQRVDPRRLVIRAFGETALLFPQTPEDGRNRRVEISTLK